MADELVRRSNELGDAWIDHIEQDARATADNKALVADLREHIPELVRCIVEFMREPDDRSRASLVTRLRLHADRRRARGYDIHQLLTDFEHLSRGMFAAFSEAVGNYSGVADVRQVADLAGRLREALMQITSGAVGMYREAELEQRRVLARKLSDFASAMTHELKNPLSAAKSGTQMLQDSDVVKTADDRDRFLRLVLRNLVRMQDLIFDIRALALADDTERRERWTQLDVLVAKVFGELEPEASRKGVRLKVEGTVPPATVDATRLEIALVNLIGNAIKYSDGTKPEPYVAVAARAEGDEGKARRWVVEVRDNGLGIPKDQHGSVFRRHFRAHKDVAEGTGLGLAIASELVVSAGGRISFRSTAGSGTTFVLDLPEVGDRRTTDRRSYEPSSSLQHAASAPQRARDSTTPR